MNFYFFQLDTHTVIDGTNYGNQARFLNHSCTPNCHTVKWIVDGVERLGIYANDHIKEGTELTYDYSYEVPNADDTTKLCPCLCGTKDCRFFLGFNKRKAKEWKEMLIAKGEWVEPETTDNDGEDEEHRKRSKKRKKKRKKKRSKKKKKKDKDKSKKKDKDGSKKKRSKKKKDKIKKEDEMKKDDNIKKEEDIDNGDVVMKEHTNDTNKEKVLTVLQPILNNDGAQISAKMKVLKLSKMPKANRVIIDVGSDDNDKDNDNDDNQASKENISNH
eukprot:CAMPEP_0201594740 /NCGR_PEP_ID=MMETSP0190_2-20130828/191958_1 /ASSEMBLY_ACC=CAM_ASM_000263 /TAXON_ID=37353 /ORGANISM="Rosalina sp." /LENGTH=272 /DNA_ID=CAMNT_0048054461 /DNA_START=1947 /DNA_END=2765 /DNA_ORIENTATION=-